MSAAATQHVHAEVWRFGGGWLDDGATAAAHDGRRGKEEKGKERVKEKERKEVKEGK